MGGLGEKEDEEFANAGASLPRLRPHRGGGGGGNRQTEKVVAVFSAPNVSSFLPLLLFFPAPKREGGRGGKRRGGNISFLI